MEHEIKDFWQSHPCGADLVGDLTDETRTEYQEFFERYDRLRYQKEPHILTNLDRMDFVDKRVLEIGLGQGADGEQIARRGGVYSAIDLTDEAVKRTKMRFSLKGPPFDRIERASALEMPFDDDSFDIVFSHGVLHHIAEIGKATKEIHRILKPDGQLTVMLYAKRVAQLSVQYFGIAPDRIDRPIYGRNQSGWRLWAPYRKCSKDGPSEISLDEELHQRQH